MKPTLAEFCGNSQSRLSSCGRLLEIHLLIDVATMTGMRLENASIAAHRVGAVRHLFPVRLMGEPCELQNGNGSYGRDRRSGRDEFDQFRSCARCEDLRRGSSSRVNRQRGALAVRSAGDLDADVQVLLHRLDVSDGAHHSSGGLQLVERSDGLL